MERKTSAIGRAKLRIYAMVHAYNVNRKKWEKAHTVDSYWERFWKKPPVPLTDEQRRQVDDFWKKYSFAYQNNSLVQEYYTYMSGRFDPRYMPPGLFTYYLFRYYDNPDYHTAFHDKNYREFIFKGFPCTPAVIRRIRGMYFDPEYTPMSFDGAVSRCHELLSGGEEKLIVKPTPGGGGSGICFVRQGNSKRKIADVLDSIKNDDIVIEKFICAHPSYAAANPTSLNSLRIISLLYDNQIEIIAIAFRMGAAGKEVDNFTQGGVVCGVNPDGICADFGVDHKGNRYTKHPNGFEFAGHQLYGVEKAVEFVKKLHCRIPQFRQMSWDIAIDRGGEPILIEMNPRGETNLYQSFGCLPFGDRTEQILDDYLLTMYYNLGANWDWDYKEYSDHIVLTGYGWDKKRVRVPETLCGKPVTAIAAGCFTGTSIQEIVVPGCVKSVDPRACAKDVTAKLIRLEDTRGIEIRCPDSVSGHALPRQCKISWSPIENATGYRIFRMPQNGRRVFVKAVSSCVTSYADHNVLSGVTYFYYVRAYNSKYNISSDFTKPLAIRAIGR